jgi:hypothetical protein
VSLIEDMTKSVENSLRIRTFIKTKDQAANDEIFRTIIGSVKKECGVRLGSLIKGSFEGNFIPSWNASLTSAGFDVVEINKSIGAFLAVKEPDEIVCLSFSTNSYNLYTPPYHALSPLYNVGIL